MVIACPNCGQTLKLDDSFLGRKMKCPACATVFPTAALAKTKDEKKGSSPAPKGRTAAQDEEPPEKVPVETESAFGTVAILLGGLGSNKAGVNTLAFSPDGKLLATAGNDGTARLWDVETGKELSTLKRPSPVLFLAFSPGGTLLALGGDSASAKATVTLWSTADLKKLGPTR